MMHISRLGLIADDLARVKMPPNKGALPKDVFPGRGPQPDFGRKPVPRPGPSPRLGPADALEIGMSFIPILGPALVIGGLLDDAFEPSPLPNPDRFRWDRRWWEVCLSLHCNDSPPFAPTDMYERIIPGRCDWTCSNAQTRTSKPVPAPLELPSPYTNTGVSFWRWFERPSGAIRWRSRVQLTFRRKAIGGLDAPSPLTLTGPVQAVPFRVGTPSVNPNYQRATPKEGPTDPEAAQPAPEPVPTDWTWSGNTGGRGPGARPAGRRPPRGRDKEKKALSRSARIGMAIFRALDKLSESAEVVDAIYDALPDHVKRRWSKGRESRRFLDQAGQYGIDGADWKLEALYHNWHHVDIQKAMKNIVKNHVEDQVIGGVHRALPNNVINAFDREFPGGRGISFEMQVSQWVDELFGG